MRKIEHKTPAKTIFPNIERWLEEHDETLKVFCLECHIHQETYYRMMYGVGNPKLSVIRSVLEHTGMTFEEAFHEDTL